MTKNEQSTTVKAETAEDLSPHNKALYEAGKSMLIESINVGREFCKFMTTTTIGAIPIYLSLLKLVLPKDYSLTARSELLYIVPALLFIISTIVFIFGYFPQKGTLSLDLPSEIEKERGKTVVRRQKYAITGFVIFCLGVVLATVIIVDALGSYKTA
jgi:hypothetical protein